VSAVSIDEARHGEGAMSRAGTAYRAAARAHRIAASSLVLALVASLLVASPWALAQGDGPPVGSMVMVTNTDGQRLNLRAGPAVDQPIVTKLPAGEVLTVTGAGRTVGVTLWVPVKTGAGQPGWVSAEYVVLLTAPSPAAPSVAEAAPAPSKPAPEVTERSSLSQRSQEKGGPVQVEAKLKFPEVKGREQEITVWVTRDGVPVPGASVTLESSDGDEGERFRQLDPTNDEGRTRRVFDVRQEKGTVEIQVEAVAPDGGEGRTTVSYFRR
jgi:uncharacterized protein YgiM (DUF1202 family)